jgi:hypothetical protein
MQKPNRERKGEIKAISNVQLNEEQKEAKRLIIENQIVIITGRAGSGKSLVGAEAGLEFLLSKQIKNLFVTRATIEVGNNLIGEPVDSIVINEFNMYEPYDLLVSKYYISSIINANPQTSNPQSLHTFQINMTNYTGTMLIQGSLSNSANPQVWVDIETIAFDNQSIAYQNIEGKYNWFRIRHTPNSLLTDPGTVDKILYR